MNQIILGIDPGTTESGICLIEAKDFNQPNIVSAEKMSNNDVKGEISYLWMKCEHLSVVIEGMANQSRAFGNSSIETCYFIGRLLEHCDSIPDKISVHLYKRHEYGRFFVNSGVLNDASLRAALETIWGPSAKKADPLYALRGASDKRSAFALAKYHEHRMAAMVKASDFAT
jgi:hypothetical protein